MNLGSKSTSASKVRVTRTYECSDVQILDSATQLYAQVYSSHKKTRI